MHTAQGEWLTLGCSGGAPVFTAGLQLQGCNRPGAPEAAAMDLVCEDQGKLPGGLGLKAYTYNALGMRAASG